MEIGLTLPTMAPDLAADAGNVGGAAALRHWSRRADRGPFSTLAVGERIAFPNPEILATLAAAAAWTERVRIAATVFVLPLHDATWLAKQTATLDVLSGGRLVVGVGVGGREEDYRAVGAPFARRHARMDEQVAELRRRWSSDTLDDGATPFGPRPVQPGGPPLWIAASGAKPLGRGARWADGLAGFDLGPDLAEVGRVFRAAEDAWREAGRPPPRRVASFWYALGPGAEARLDAYARRYLAVFGAAPAAALARRCRAAGEARLRELLAGLRDLGTDEVLLVPTTAHPDELERTLDAVA